MNAAELINAVGIDNVKVQFLDTCASDLNWSAKSGSTKIRFETDVALTPDGTELLGMVVWLPRDGVSKAMAAARGGAS